MSDLTNTPIDFPAILASSVHDIKNSLTTVRELIAHIANKQNAHKNNDFIQLEFEANRMNNSLVQLLELYKIDAKIFNLNIDEYSASEILQEIKAQQAPLLELNKNKLNIDCPEDLYCYCDFEHICNALNTILNNAQRYTSTEIHLSAYQEQDYIVFCMEDNGAGYPDQLLAITETETPSITHLSGSTGLGLHFAAMLAKLHTSKDNKGFIKIDNNSSLDGARFRLFLP